LSFARLLVFDLVLLVASLPGVVNVLAKDHVSTAEGVIAWISLIALVVSLFGLALLVVRAVRALVRRR
jgi:hypothetical protein